NPHEIAHYTLYLAGFAKIKTCLEFKALRKLISDIKTNLLQKLPDTPHGLDKQIRSALPFILLLKDRKQIWAAAITLHQAFTFDLLPESYIEDERTSILAHPADLNEATRNLFPITTRAELKKIRQHKQDLQKYYIFSHIPNTYFNLPPKKLPLPTTPQDLTPSLQRLFPFYPTSSDHFCENINILRQVYTFQTLPNDYLISKKKLPTNPEQLGLRKFSFPIKDVKTLSKFFQSLPKYYARPEPLHKP